MKNISRVDGRNGVKSAAYRHGQIFGCERTDEIFNYSRKKDVDHCEISVPENSPEWAQELSRLDAHEASRTLWNAVECIERRKDARISKEVEFSLPHELTQEQRISLAREFIQETFTSKGMIADWSVHNHFDDKDSIEKPHVHVMLTTRVLKDSFSVGDEVHGHGDIFFGEKERSWNDKSLLQEIRQSWEVCANRHLERAGLDVRIDHRSYKERGIELEAQPKMGKGSQEMVRRGSIVDRLQAMEKTKERNRLLIQRNPEIVLETITRQQSVFTKRDMARIINRYVDGRDESQVLLARVEACPGLVRISDDRVGAEQKFTTQAMIDLEVSLMRKAETMRDAPVAFVPEVSQSWFVLEANDRMMAQQTGALSSDQVRAIHHMTDEGQLKVVVGYAGAGKSTCLKVAKDIWEEEGYRVVGAAPTGKAADNLEGTGIASKTLHKWEHEWKKDRELLGKGDIFVVDEAGMIDARRLNSLLEESQKRGFKVVLVGDPEQLSPIEAGCGLRTVMDKAGFAEMTTIQRHYQGWQREATKELATRQTQKALKRYEEKDCIHLVQNAKDRLIEDYALQMQTRLPEESLDSVILAYTNKDVQDLNQRARAIAKASGRLQGPDHLLTVTRYKNEDLLAPPGDSLLKIVRDEKPFSIGDQIVFLRNDYGVGVKNGQFGIIQRIDEGMIQVEVDKGKVLQFDLSLYSSFDHGYATTIHKSQASTVQKTFLYASQGLDRHLTYVGLSRHRDEVHLYAEQDIFGSHETLYAHLSRDNPKENVFDYGVDRADLERGPLHRPGSEPDFSYTPSHPRSPTVYEVFGSWMERTVDKTKDWLHGRSGEERSFEEDQGFSREDSRFESPALSPQDQDRLEVLAALEARELERAREDMSVLDASEKAPDKALGFESQSYGPDESLKSESLELASAAQLRQEEGPSLNWKQENRSFPLREKKEQSLSGEPCLTPLSPALSSPPPLETQEGVSSEKKERTVKDTVMKRSEESSEEPRGLNKQEGKPFRVKALDQPLKNDDIKQAQQKHGDEQRLSFSKNPTSFKEALHHPIDTGPSVPWKQPLVEYTLSDDHHKEPLPSPEASPSHFTKTLYDSPQERDDVLRAYLKDEVRPEKHVWLKESDLPFLLKDVDKNPMKTLERWQDVSGDKRFHSVVRENQKDSPQLESPSKNPLEGNSLERLHSEISTSHFYKDWELSLNPKDKPFTTESTADALRLRKQTQEREVSERVIEAPYNQDKQERHDSILAYLKDEVRPEKHAWLKEESLPYFLEGAEKDPLKALKKWHDISRDDSFQPMTKAEAKLKDVQAQQILEKAQASLSKETYQKLTQDLPEHSQGVIQRCQSALDKQQEKQRNLDVEKFLSLSRDYQKIHRNCFTATDQEKQDLREKLLKVSAPYEKDELFMKEIQKAPDRALKDFALELFKKEDLTKQRERSLERSFGIGW